MNKIKGYRNMLMLTQTQMAEKLGMGLTSYNFKEQGKRTFNSSEMQTFTRLVREKKPEITMQEIFFTE